MIENNSYSNNNEQVSVADQLSWSFEAHQDLQQAEKLYRQLKIDDGNVGIGIFLNQVQAELDVDPQALTDKIIAFARSGHLSQYHKEFIYARLSLVKAILGNQKEALKLIKLSEIECPGMYALHAYIDMADILRKSGHDSHDIIKTLQLASEAIDQSDICLSQKSLHHENVAKAYFRAGFSDRISLRKAEEAIKMDGGRRKSYWYGPLAETYAYCGLFKEALKFVPKITTERPDRVKEEKVGAIFNIAREQAKVGDFNQALELLGKSNDLKLIAYLAAEIAVLAGKKDPQTNLSWLATALHHVRPYSEQVNRLADDNIGHLYLAEILNKLSHADYLFGNDPTLFLQAALTQALLPHPNWQQAQILSEIAETHINVGVEGNEKVFTAALESADNIVDWAINNNRAYMLTGAEQICTYKDIGEVAIRCGQDHLLEDIFTRFDKYGPELDFECETDKVELLLTRAQARARRIV